MYTVWMTRFVFFLLLAACLSGCGQDTTGKPPFADLMYSRGYRSIDAPDGRTWQVQYERKNNTVFAGTVRHAEAWADPTLPFMTHDILITSGEYSSILKVYTSVRDHHYIYKYWGAEPAGTINLLHIYPETEEVYRQLQKVKLWDRVKITGREILKIDKFDEKGEYAGFWTDMGCNTILVTSVEMESNEAKLP